MYQILLCDDEEDILYALKIYLQNPEYQFFEAHTGLEAVSIARENLLDLVLMDIMMPEMDGMAALKEIRKISNVPVIFLTAKGEEMDKVIGLSEGADDYVAKPFQPMEVRARVKSQLRRYTALGGSRALNHVLRHGGIEMDDDKKQVLLDGEEISLTPTEYQILKLLLEHPGKVFSPSEIYSYVWKEEMLGGDGTVAVHIRHLREKMEIDPAQPRYIKVVWGQGYRLEN